MPKHHHNPPVEPPSGKPETTSLYETIAAEYERLFPLNEAFLQFLKTLVPAGARVLDLACGPGHYVRELAGIYDMTGCDISQAMISEARRICKADVHVLGFADIAKLPPGFDCIYCIGNSLSYLPNPDLPAFLGTIRNLLSETGLFIAHTVNWDAYLQTGEMDFPAVRLPGERIFTREYQRLGNDKVLFHTAVRHSAGQQTWTDTLFPKTATALRTALEQAGLPPDHHFGDYRKTPFNSLASPVSIFVCRRK